tara:strand:- start:13873 stop:15987 length:2115 start_codon:yes stop_codon:yes gene_type:complete
MTEIRCIKNRKSKTVELGEPWNVDRSKFPEFPSKSAFREWENSKDAETCCYNLVEGEIPTDIISKHNSPKWVHGVVADFDVRMDDRQFKKFMTRVIDADYQPNWICRSFSGGAHLIYQFEKKIPYTMTAHFNRFMTALRQELAVESFGPEFDKKAWSNTACYFSPGTDWVNLNKEPLGENMLYSLLYSTSKITDFSGHAVEIPMDLVAEEMEKQYPGELTNMKVGDRCRFFWDEGGGVNTSGCVVRPEGMTVFTDSAPKPFYSWEEILGRDFVRKFEEDKIGGCIAPYFFDGKEYMFVNEGKFEVLSKESLRLALECRHGLASRPPKKGGPSEMHKAIYTIESSKRVAGFLPFVFLKDRLVDFRGKTYFNTSTITPIQPSEEGQGWGDGFPTIAKWMEHMFGEEQLRYELAWLGYAYRNALKGEPEKGHAHFLCGPPNCGKTLYNTTVLGGLFGGHMKATEYFMSVTPFNDYLFEEGFWTIDDSEPASDKKQLDKFTSMVKEFVANDEFQIATKFKKSGRVFWRGRLGVTLNDDPESIRLIPDLGMSIMDKIMVFRCEAGYKFTRETKSLVESELPMFARWLADAETPHDLVDVRFGVKSYINSDIKDMHRQSGELETFIAIFDWARNSLADTDIPGRDGVWQGTAGELLTMAETEGAKVLIRGLGATELGVGFTKLFLQGWSGLKRIETRANRTEWQIQGPKT